MDNTSELVLDHVETIQLTAEQTQSYTDEIGALQYLAQGLESLFQLVISVEDQIQFRSAPRRTEISFGEDPRLEGLPVDLVRCSFDWYSVSICNYTRLVGWIWHEIDANAPGPLEYVNSVVPEAKAWRDSVGAHFERAHSSGQKSKNRAKSTASVWRPIPILDGRFVAGAMTLSVRASGKDSDSKALQPWSLTQSHGDLRKRYWPELQAQRDHGKEKG